MTAHTRTTMGVAAVAAAAALLLSACGSETAELSADDSNLTPLETGFLAKDIGKDITTTGTVRPQLADTVTPSGTVKISGIQELDSITPQQIGPDAPQTSDDVEAYGPADGEVLRVIELTYTPTDTQGTDTGGTTPTTDLSINLDGTQVHLSELDGQQDHRILVSVPEAGTAQLVISSESHDQFVDVLTGERQDDDVAAAYYLPNPRQEPTHTFKIDSDTFPTQTSSGRARGDITTDFTVKAISAELTAWNPEDGWAAPGNAWLAVTWNHDLGLTADASVLSQIDDLKTALSIDVAGTVTKDEIHAQNEIGNVKGDRTAYVPVSIDTNEVVLSVSGSVTVSTPNGSGLEMAGETSADFASDELTITFN